MSSAATAATASVPKRVAAKFVAATADEPAFHRDRSTTFTPTHDGKWAEYSVRLPSEKPLTALRIDPSTAAGEIRIVSVRLKGKDGKAIQEWTADPPEKK